MSAGCGGSEEQPIREWLLHAPGTPEAGVPVSLPARLDDHLPSRRSAYRLETRVPIPEAWRGRPLSVAIPHFTGLTELRADGWTITAPDTDLVQVYRSRGPQVWVLPASVTRTAEVDLVLDVQHTWEQSAWFDSTPVLTTRQDGGTWTVVVRFFNEVASAISVGALLMISAFALIFFLLDRRHRGYAWLSLAAGAVCYYTAFILGITQVVGPRVDTPLTGVCVTTAIIAVLYMAHTEFELKPPSRLWGLAWLGNLVLSLVVTDPFESPTILGRAVVAIVVVTLARLMWLYWQLHRRPEPARGAIENLFALGFFTACTIPSAALWSGLPDPAHGVRTVTVGLFVYALVQFVVVVRSHLFTLELSERREQEILVLNAELRRQVAERSQRLSEALARLGVASEETIVLREGQNVDDRYRVVRRIGEGAMGIAYEVVRLSDERRVAMKVLTTVHDARLMARFAREAHIAANLDHPNLVRILDVNFAQSGFMYLVMEYVDGASLDREKERFGHVDWALAVLRDVAAGLTAIHAEGIAHRDLKPSNVLLAIDRTERIHAKIADFGISGMVAERKLRPSLRPNRPVDPEASLEGTAQVKFTAPPPPTGPGSTEVDLDPAGLDEAGTLVLTGEVDAEATATIAMPGNASGSLSPSTGSDHGLTQAGEIVGTPAYMAPELIDGQTPAGFASDMFSFGVLAFQLLTGRLPYGEPPSLARLRGAPLPTLERLRDARPEVPEDIADLVDLALSYDPGRRPRAEVVSIALSPPSPSFFLRRA